MRVFAEYVRKHEIEYRKKTLLFFGNSMELIGSAVLINPGSAKPLKTNDVQLVNNFYRSQFPEEHIREIDWKEFRPDSTMRWLKNIFSGHYIGHESTLNGVIQLFNCFYIKSQNLEHAALQFPDSEFAFDEERFFLDKPVFFGWGKHESVRTKGREIFNSYQLTRADVYNLDYEKNDFYHPGYINRSYKKTVCVRRQLEAFYRWVNENSPFPL